MQKTVVVAIERRVPHPVYGKMMTRTKRLKAHDEENSAKAGDTVRIIGDPPAVEGQAVARGRDRRARALREDDYHDPTGIDGQGRGQFGREDARS